MNPSTFGGLFSWWMLLAVAGPAGATSTPRLEFQKIIGDMRGKGMHNLSVAVTDQGEVCLLMQEHRVAVFGPDGRYRQSLAAPLRWPYTYTYLAAAGRRLLIGNYQEDYPWLFSDQRRGSAPGRFLQPAMATVDGRGFLYVADRGNRRVQVFAAGNTDTPCQIVELPSGAGPIGLARSEAGAGLLAVVTDQGTVLLLESAGQGYKLVASMPLAGARCVAFGPPGDLFVACNAGPNRHELKRYQCRDGSLAEAAVLAPSYMQQWPNFYPTAAPLTVGPDGQVWFAAGHAGYSILSLDPKTDTVSERLRTPFAPLSVGFDRTGRAWVAGFARPGQKGPHLAIFSRLSPEASGEPFWHPDRPLYEETGVPVWGLLPDVDGGVYMRLVEPGYRKGWPALTFKKILADGTVRPFLDFGELFAKRRMFHPAGAAYSLKFDRDHHLILAALPLRAVYKAAPDGRLLWEAGPQPQGGADAIDFGAPCDTAIDSRGRIWVVDADSHRLFCLSSEGKLLGSFGAHAGVDDTVGAGFDAPHGLAVVTCDGHDYLYVGDTGNQRLVKYRIAG